MLESFVCDIAYMIICDIIGVPIVGETLLPGPNFGGPNCPTPDLGIML